MVHLMRVSAIEGRRGETLDLIDRILKVSPEGDQALAMRALRAYTTGDPSGIDHVAADLQRARAVTVAIAFSDVALYSGDLAGAEALARSFIRAARSPELRALCYVLVAHVALARGEDMVAMKELRMAESLDHTWGIEMRGLFATLPFRSPTSGELHDIRQALASWDPAAAAPSMFMIFAMHNHLHAAIRAYLLGLLEIRLDDVGQAAEQLNVLEGLAETDDSLVGCLKVELNAAIVRASGNPEQALAILEASHPRLWFQLTVASPFFSLASQRYLRAELLRELGRLDEAAGWYRSIAERSPYELVYAAPARQRLEEMTQQPVTH
jgi:tetratricopeptide (TPR) repeat protein